MGAPEPPPLVAKCRSLSNPELLALFAELLGNEEDKHFTSLPALALRDRARAGEVEDELVPLLVFCVVDAPNYSTFVHLAKALAAFGRAAEMASPYLVDRLQGLHVTNDRRFWVLDSTLWCLGYTGGPAASAYVDQLAGEAPLKVNAAKSVFQGELDEAARTAQFEATLAGVRALLDQRDPGVWRQKRTSSERHLGEKARSRMAPWMIR